MIFTFRQAASTPHFDFFFFRCPKMVSVPAVTPAPSPTPATTSARSCRRPSRAARSGSWTVPAVCRRRLHRRRKTRICSRRYSVPGFRRLVAAPTATSAPLPTARASWPRTRDSDIIEASKLRSPEPYNSTRAVPSSKVCGTKLFKIWFEADRLVFEGLSVTVLAQSYKTVLSVIYEFLY